ncbi:MAG: hypothetical protein Q9219_006761 [cf. Caloplaca sp. 3 TL-2023]
MFNHVVSNVLVLTTCLFQVTAAIPLEPLPESAIRSPPPPSALSIPPSFKVEISTSPTTISNEGAYRAAIQTMYAVTDFPLAHVWLDHTWGSPLGPTTIRIKNEDFGKATSRLSTQYIIWGLNHLMLSFYLSRQKSEMTATLKWEGVEVGVIELRKRVQTAVARPQLSQNETTDLVLPNLPSSLTTTERFETHINYPPSAPLIPREIIFLTGIRAMSDAAEKGLDNPPADSSIVTQGVRGVVWHLGGGTRLTPGVLKWGHSRLAVLETLGSMISDDKFQVVVVWVKVNGLSVAVGGFHK